MRRELWLPDPRLRANEFASSESNARSLVATLAFGRRSVALSPKLSPGDAGSAQSGDNWFDLTTAAKGRRV